MNKQSRKNPIFELCPECRILGEMLRFFTRFKRDHLLMDVAQRYGISIRSLHESLPVISGRPGLKRFYRMMNGSEPMPAALEIWIWQYLYTRGGRWWIIVAQWVEDGRSLYMTADTRILEEGKKSKGA